ncbi:hypothetical protein QEN19_002736 [Hanseniaspora menglaensis]
MVAAEKEQLLFLESIFSHLDLNTIKDTFENNHKDFDCTFNKLSTKDTKHDLVSEMGPRFGDLSIGEDIFREKATIWLSIFPQLDYAEIYKVISNTKNITDDDTILEELNFLLFNKNNKSLAKSSETKNIKNNESFNLANEIIIFEYDIDTIIKDNLIIFQKASLTPKDEIVNIKVKEFLSVCMTSIEMANYTLEVNKFHIGRAITNCILNYHQYARKLKDTVYRAKATNINLSSGVVQRNRKPNLISANTLSRSSLSKISVFNDKMLPPFSKTYLIEDEKYIKKALDTCKSKFIILSFFKLVFSFFNGDEVKSLKLLQYFDKMNFLEECQSMVSATNYNESQDNVAKNPYIKNSTTSKSSKKTYTVKKYSIVTKQKPSFFFSKSLQLTEAPCEYSYKFTTGKKIDLHGYTGKEAITLISGLLSDWWNEELLQREAKATKEQQIKTHKAQFVAVLEIVTGKGLHSESGKSVLKKRCKTYLLNQNYTFVENSGSFVVTGRKQAFKKI